jgi:hypothetical protein
MRRRFTLTLAALALLATAPLIAQGPPEIKPGPEHALLKEWEGTWDGTFKNKDGGDSKATSVYKVDLNGLWVLENLKADMGGKTFEGRGGTSYDAAKKKYINVWIDNMSTSPMISEGTYDKATKTLTLVGDMPTPDGKTMKTTLTTVFTGPNTKTFTLKGGGPDGKEFDMVHMTFTRRSK